MLLNKETVIRNKKKIIAIIIPCKIRYNFKGGTTKKFPKKLKTKNKETSYS